jgi:hypothetical protein
LPGLGHVHHPGVTQYAQMVGDVAFGCPEHGGQLADRGRLVADLEVPAELAFEEAYRRAAAHVVGMPGDPERNRVTDEARTVLGPLAVAG